MPRFSPQISGRAFGFAPAAVALTLILLTGSSPADPPSHLLDLNGQATTAGVLTRLHGHGSNNDGRHGVPVCGGFDCDGDGFREVAIANIHGAPLGRSNAGEVTVFFGDGTIGGTFDTNVFDARTLRIAGAQANEISGGEIWMDDVTGDGLGDLLIGRQAHSFGGRAAVGALTIIAGSAAFKAHAATLALFDLAAPPAGVTVVTFVGALPYDRLGIWMRTGDIDGDGVADIVVGADEADAAGQAISYNSGSVYVIRGGAHLAAAPAVVDLGSFGSTDLEGHIACILPPVPSLKFHFGATVQVGDLDGNGRAEVLAAATLNRAGASLGLPSPPPGTTEVSGGAPFGALFISWDENFPPSPWPPGYTFTVTNPPLGDFTRIDGKSFGGGEENEDFGEEILAGLDYSGDGYPDLFVGDLTGDTPNGTRSGLGNVFYNASNLRGRSFLMNFPPADIAITTMWGPIAGAIGNDTAGHGDFNGDGIGDLATGNPHDIPLGRGNAGTVHILYGQPGGWPPLIDQSDGNLPDPEDARVAQINGANGASGSDSGDTLCYSAAVADIDGNGSADFIVNEMQGNGFAGVPEDVGNLLVISGTALFDSFTPSLSFSTAGPLAFGSRDVTAGPGAAVPVVITNNGSGPVAIDSLTLQGPAAGDFSIASDSGESSLNPGGTRTLGIVFDPAGLGDKGAALVVVTDTDLYPARLGLGGTGMGAVVVPEVEKIQLIGNGFGLWFHSQRGFTYSLLGSPDLAAPVDIFTGISGTGAIVPLYHPGALANPRFFYHVEGESFPEP